MPDMQFVLRKIAVPLILASFLMTVFFGFSAMGYWPEAMQGDCPFSSVMGTPSCPQNLFAMTLHHLSSYQSFLQAPAVPDLAALMSALLIAAGLLVITFYQPVLLGPPLRNRPASRVLPVSWRRRKMIRWLSLLEHSPSGR